MSTTGTVRFTHPVGQPLLVVVGRRGLDGLDREVGRETPADDVGDERSETEGVEEDKEDGAVVCQPDV